MARLLIHPGEHLADELKALDTVGQPPAERWTDGASTCHGRFTCGVSTCS